ncbi:MAG: helix-turn-helix domain-containing protein [Chitinophagaceae bacterium]|nr:helix-turn-helix domain-containing protein [Chitinophagaceae bacterium]
MAEKQSIAQKKEHAKLLYTVEGVTVGKELAERVGVSPQTISKWINSEDWEMIRASLIMTREAELRRLYSRLTFLNDTIEERETKEKKPITNSEADTLVKISASIKNMETDVSVSEAIQVLKDFINAVRSSNLALAKSMTVEADHYIKSLL